MKREQKSQVHCPSAPHFSRFGQTGLRSKWHQTWQSSTWPRDAELGGALSNDGNKRWETQAPALKRKLSLTTFYVFFESATHVDIHLRSTSTLHVGYLIYTHIPCKCPYIITENLRGDIFCLLHVSFHSLGERGTRQLSERTLLGGRWQWAPCRLHLDV